MFAYPKTLHLDGYSVELEEKETGATLVARYRIQGETLAEKPLWSTEDPAEVLNMRRAWPALAGVATLLTTTHPDVDATVLELLGPLFEFARSHPFQLTDFKHVNIEDPHPLRHVYQRGQYELLVVKEGVCVEPFDGSTPDGLKQFKRALE